MMTSRRNALEDATEAVADEEEERLSALGEDRLRPARAVHQSNFNTNAAFWI